MSSPERRLAIEAARAAGELLRSELAGARRIAFKGAPTNLVTEMDARAEALILDRVRASFPEDAILSEEMGATSGPSGRRWIAVSIALEVAGRVQLGVIYDPNHDELFVAERGRGAFVNDRKLVVSSASTLDESLLVSGFPYNLRETTDNNVPEYAAFSLRAQGVRRMGSAVLYLAWLAAGRFDGYWELRTGPWDVAAGGLLVEEAGGRVTALDGGPLDLDRPAIVASNGRIHGEMLKLLAEVRRR